MHYWLLRLLTGRTQCQLAHAHHPTQGGFGGPVTGQGAEARDGDGWSRAAEEGARARPWGLYFSFLADRHHTPAGVPSSEMRRRVRAALAGVLCWCSLIQA